MLNQTPSGIITSVAATRVNIALLCWMACAFLALTIVLSILSTYLLTKWWYSCILVMVPFCSNTS